MLKKILDSTKKKLKPVREWIDGKDEELIKSVRIEPTASEVHFGKLIESIKSKVLDKKVIRVGGEVYLPGVYNIYLSSGDFDGLLEAEKKFIEKKLTEAILNKARDLAGRAKLTTEEFHVRLYEDGTLALNEIDVKTVDNLSDTVEIGEIDPDSSSRTIDSPTGTIDIDIVDFEPLYFLEIWEADKMVNEYPILKNQITIGRDTREQVANIRLKTDDKQISSLHAAIRFRSKSDITVEALHKNITKVGKIIISTEKEGFSSETKLKKNDEIRIFEFLLKVRF